MGLNNGINVRLTPEVRARLESLAELHGVKASVLIRQAIIEKLDEVERQSAVIFHARKEPPAKAVARKKT